MLVAHRKWKTFGGHHVKEIGNFGSGDAQDYARRANFCEEHRDELRFYCKNCQICICRDCATVEHRDHNMISLDKGIENNKAEIEIKMHKIEKNGSRLRNHGDHLQKRRLGVHKSIEEAKSEVERVGEHCISMICEHKASVTEHRWPKLKV